MFDIETGECTFNLLQNQATFRSHFIFMGVGNFCVGNMLFLSYGENVFFNPQEHDCKFIIVTESGELVVAKSFNSFILASTKNKHFEPTIVHDDSVISLPFNPNCIKAHITGNYLVIVHCGTRFFY